MIATELKTGKIFKDNDDPFVVIKYFHIKSARGGASVKVKAKNLLTGAGLEKSYLGTAKIEEASVRRKSVQYLYKDTGYVFMNPDTYEQFIIPKSVLGDKALFLSEGENVQVMYFEEKPVSVDLPNSMIFEVTYTEPGYKGNTVSNVFKDATITTGAQIKVPTFVKIGDKVKVDTRTREYISKA